MSLKLQLSHGRADSGRARRQMVSAWVVAIAFAALAAASFAVDQAVTLFAAAE
jgi:hypothetical protein